MTTHEGTGTDMAEREARAFLGERDHGVLSLGVADRGYGFPIAYTYDDDADRILFGFVNAPDSRKQAFADETDEATFTVYSYDDVDAWRSVLVRGPVRPATDVDSDVRVPDVFFRTDGDAVNLDEYDRYWHELAIDDLSGRKSG